MPGDQPLVINGWNIFAHPLFLEQFEELVTQVEHLRCKEPNNYKKKNATKRLAAITKLAFDVIPQDPTRRDYQQGSARGEDYKHWFRAKHKLPLIHTVRLFQCCWNDALRMQK